MASKLSKEHYINLIKNKSGVSLVSIDGEFKGSRTRITLMCDDDGHQWSSSFSTAARGTKGCAVCARNKPISKIDAEKLIESYGRDRFLSWDGDFVGMHSRVNVACASCGHVRSAKLYSITRNGRRCPECTRGGFKFDSDGFLYVLKSSCGTMVKFGISNNHKKRMQDLRFETPFEFDVVGIIRGSGRFVSGIEAIAIRETNQAIIDGSFSGYTEWRVVDKESIALSAEFLGVHI